jgi:transglutaminase-like putative cysteine protease
MRLRIEHTTTFTYDHPISEAYTEMRLRPLSDNGQHVVAFMLSTEPHDEVLMHVDRFGNDVRHFDVVHPHQRLMATATSEVLTPEMLVPDMASLTPLDEFDFLMPTPYAPFAANLVQFAATHVVLDDPAATAQALMHALFTLLKYERGATDVTTTADEALELGRGVCQDFSHIMLAACRSQGLPARYVSGYLYNSGQAAASHAWVDVHIAGHEWLSLDPTHDCAQSSEYVRVAIGRDYADVPPTRGVFKGNAKETMNVEVMITKM